MIPAVRKPILTALLAAQLAAPIVTLPQSAQALSQEELLTILGGVAGAFGGAQIGRNNDERIAFGLAGLIMGAALGNVVGRSLDEADRQALARAQSEALESEEDIRREWMGPRTRNRGAFWTGRRGYMRQYQSVVCREWFSEIHLANGQTETNRGYACRTSDGRWTEVREQQILFTDRWGRPVAEEYRREERSGRTEPRSELPIQPINPGYRPGPGGDVGPRPEPGFDPGFGQLPRQTIRMPRWIAPYDFTEPRLQRFENAWFDRDRVDMTLRLDQALRQTGFFLNLTDLSRFLSTIQSDRTRFEALRRLIHVSDPRYGNRRAVLRAFPREYFSAVSDIIETRLAETH